jgi:hypothetical protein
MGMKEFARNEREICDLIIARVKDYGGCRLSELNGDGNIVGVLERPGMFASKVEDFVDELVRNGKLREIRYHVSEASEVHKFYILPGVIAVGFDGIEVLVKDNEVRSSSVGILTLGILTRKEK